MFVGVLLVVLGVLMLLSQLDIIQGRVWDYFWPAAIVALGASMIFRDRKRLPPPQ